MARDSSSSSAGTGLHHFRKWAAAGTIALVAVAAATALSFAPVFSVAVDRLHDVFYDTFYRVRPMPPPATRRAIGADVKDEDAFLLHYHGRHDPRAGPYRYLAAANVLAAAQDPTKAASVGITPDIFRDKIVLIGGTAMGTYDL